MRSMTSASRNSSSGTRNWSAFGPAAAGPRGRSMFRRPAMSSGRTFPTIACFGSSRTMGPSAFSRRTAGTRTATPSTARGASSPASMAEGGISRLDHDGTWRPLATHFEGRRLKFAERRRRQVGRIHLVLRPDLRHRRLLRRRACAKRNRRRSSVPARPRVRRTDRGRSRPRAPERPGVFSERIDPLCRRHRRDPCSDTPRAIHAYAVVDGGRSLSTAKTFAVCDNGFFDGFRVDIHGNLWTSSADFVRAYAPDGALIGRVRAPEIVSNLCLGSPRRNRLYITAQTSLYAIYLNTHAANWIAA